MTIAPGRASHRLAWLSEPLGSAAEATLQQERSVGGRCAFSSTSTFIEKLGPEWQCEHDLEHESGNWDHVLVGPAGVFLLDSKRLHGTVAAGGDVLRSGRLTFPGGRFRAGAKRIKLALEARLGARAPWVQAVVVVWGEFPQAQHDEQDVVYLSGDELRPWLSELPTRLNAPGRAALVTALQEVRASLPARKK